MESVGVAGNDTRIARIGRSGWTVSDGLQRRQRRHPPLKVSAQTQTERRRQRWRCQTTPHGIHRRIPAAFNDPAASDPSAGPESHLGMFSVMNSGEIEFNLIGFLIIKPEELSQRTLLHRWMASVAPPIPELSPWRSTWPPVGQYAAFPVPFQFFPPPLHLATMTSQPFLPAPFYLPTYSATSRLPLYTGGCNVELPAVPTHPEMPPASVETQVKGEILPDEPDDSVRCQEFLPEPTLPAGAAKRPAFLSVETLLSDLPDRTVPKNQCSNSPEENTSVNVTPPPPR